MRNFGSVRQGRLRRGFTLLEMAVVIVIIGILIAILLRAVQQVRDQARKIECRNNLKQLVLGVHEYQEIFNYLPASSSVWGRLIEKNKVDVHNSMSWGSTINAYIDARPLPPDNSRSKASFDKVNAQYVGQADTTYLCPTVTNRGTTNEFSLPKGTVVYPPFSTAEDYRTTYGAADYIVHCGVTEGFRKAVYQEREIPKDGTGALGPIQFHPDEALAKAMMKKLGEVPTVKHSSFDDVKDGDSNTILISESAGRNELWRRGRRIGEKQDPAAYARQKMMGGGGWADPFNQTWINGRQSDGTGTSGPCAINCSNEPDAGLYSFHAGGAHAALVDGSVRFLNEKLSPMILGRLVMRADGEKIEGEF